MLSLNDILNSHRTRRGVVMGILNVTPDSFSDGGLYSDPAAAVEHARRMIAEGAAIIDIGAESTRPGSQHVEPAEQIRRLEHVLGAVCRLGCVVSIDTTRSEVAEYALDRGAQIVNDISAGLDDPALLELIARRGAAIVLMHMLGQPRTMQVDPRYEDVVREVRDFLATRIAAAEQAGIARDRMIVDPGIGFGKRLEHNLQLLRGVDYLAALDRPVLIGASRKRFIGELSGVADASARVGGSVAACLEAWRRGSTIFRVHDVAATASALAVAGAIEKQR